LTVLGPPGIGKSRLVRDFVEKLGKRATILYGRCLPYGEGVTYWPVVEVLRQAAARPVGQTPEETLRTLAELVGGEGRPELVLKRIAHLFGAGEVSANSEETAWALRKLLEALARQRPVVCVLDDLQFGEPTLLDLVEHVADRSRAAPILLVCLARVDLLEMRPAWGDGKVNATRVLLEPLAPAESEELVSNLLTGSTPGGRIASAITAAAGGNPFFVEEIVAMLIEEGLLRHMGGTWVATGDLSAVPVPATVQALLAARLDRLPSEERDAIERAAIEGEVFHVSGVAELSPGVPLPEVESRLMALVRKELIGSHPATFRGDHAFRFRHLLIRDAAYSALPKQLRAEFHQGVADWLETKSDAQDEIVGYHLERTYRYRTELGLPRDPMLATKAGERLGAAARRALARGDVRAGSRLLERAASLFPLDDPSRLVLLPKLGAAFFQAGMLAEAKGVLIEAIERAEAEGDARIASHARVEQQFVRLMADSSRRIDDARGVADTALRVFEENSDDFGCCRAWCLRAWIEWTRCSSARADRAWRRAAVYARRTGQEQELFQILCWRASSALFGPTPVARAIRRCDEIHKRVRSSPGAGAVTSHQLAALHAMRGGFAVARTLIREGNEILNDLGRMNSAVSHAEGWVELLAGRPAAAEERLRLGYGRLEQMGEKAFLASTAAMLAQAIYAQGRYGEAEQFCQVSHSTAAAEDLVTQVMWRGVRAKILARQNRMEEADVLAREALKMAEQTDWLTHHADALLDFSHVVRLMGLSVEADAAARESIKLYERKGNVVSAGAARSWLAAAAPA
jgi:predicted ATPase